MTAITEQTRNSSKAARGLNSIFNNLAQVLDDSSSNGKKITEIFNNLGVSMYDLNTGQLLSSYELLGNLAEKWGTLDTNTKNYIASTIAGTHQLNNFLALMNNFDHAIEATETALNSAGSAARENSRYMEGLEAKTQAVKASFQELANTVVNSGLVKGILDLANGFLQLLNSPIGAFVTQITLLTGVLWGGTGLIKAMKLIPNLFASAATTISGFTGVLSLTAPKLMLIAAGIAAIMAVAPAISNWWKEFTGDVEYLNEKIEESNSKLTKNKDRLKDLLSIPPSSRSSEIEDEIAYLQMENEELEKNIRLYKEKVNQSSLKDIRGWHNIEQETPYYQMTWQGSGEALNLPSVTSEQEAIDKLKELGYEYENAGNKIEDFGITLTKVYKRVSISSDEYLTKLIQDTKDTVSSFQDVANASEDEKQAFIDTYNQIQAYADTLSYARDNGEVLSESEIKLISYAEQLEGKYADLLNQMYPAEDSLKRLAEGAALNANEFSNLVAVYPDLADALEESDGLYKINQESLYNLAAQGNETARALIKAQIEATEQTITSTEQRIKAYMSELEALQQLSGQKILGAWGPSTPAGASANIMNMLMGEDGKSRTEVLSDTIEQEKNNLLEAKNNLAELLAQVESWDAEVTGFDTGSGSSSSSGGSSKTTDPIKEQSDAFKELNEIIEHNIFLREKQGASEQELIGLYKDYQDQLNKEADWFREHGVDENSEYIRELQKQWWELEDTITDLQHQAFDERLEISENYIEDRNDLGDWGADNEIAAYQRVLDWMDQWYKDGLIDYEYYWEQRVAIAKKQAEAEKEAWEEAMEAQIEELKSQQDVYEKLFSYMSDRIDEQIDALQEQRDAEEAYWDEKIQALQDQNDEIERQIELEQLQEALARAKQSQVLVYKDGRFQYTQNVEEVNEAQANLESYEREEALRQEVENLEKLKDQALASIDEQIEGWEEYKKQWSSVVDHYQEEQDRLLLEQELGIELEGELWQTRLDSLSDYVAEYEALMQRLTDAQAQLNAGFQGGSSLGGGGAIAGGGGSSSGGLGNGVSFGGGYDYSDTGESIISSGGSGGKDWSDVWWDAEHAYENGLISREEADKIQQEAHWKEEEAHSGSGATFNPDSGKWEYASGTLSAHGGLSLVGEEGPELRVLNHGDGIIPANATKNLMELSKYSIKDILASKGQTMYSYMFDKIVLPNVTDFNSFVNELKRFKRFAYQQ